MAVYIDNLAFQMLTLVMTSGVVVYVTGKMYLEFRKNGTKNVEATLRQAMFPLGLLGALITALGFWAEITWPFPDPLAQFNILFGDPYLLFGIILLSMALSIAFKQKLQYAGFFALLGGIMAVYYGSTIYSYQYTQEPLASLGMYLAFGVAGILTWPATLAYDSMDEKASGPSTSWGILLFLFWLAFILAAIFTGLIGVPAVFSHAGATP